MTTGNEDKDLIANRIREKYTTERTLRGSLSVVFRPIEPTDQCRYTDFFKSLSKESVHQRFFEIKKLSDEALERCCNLDYTREIAIIAETRTDRKIIAMARLIFDSNYGKGEFALVVADAWQGLGLGTELLGYTIKIARDYKLKEMHYVVSNDNYRMIGLSEKMGFKVKSTDGDTLEMSLQLE